MAITNEAYIILTAAAPVVELRGSIPLGLYLLGMENFLKVFLLSVFGNFLPIIPVLLLLSPVSEKLRRFFIWRRFFDWFFEHTRKKADLIEKYEALGLMLFVAVPLPGTGIWAGAVAATLFKIRFRYAVLAITLGMFIAGVLVSLVCFGAVNVPIFIKQIIK
ncbi:MAG TPA: small multi-drug export protein [Candidatus Omnitrophota bacterium]|nr:small multi-drug export protein [Candidatus Omnitrophota bacterium]